MVLAFAQASWLNPYPQNPRLKLDPQLIPPKYIGLIQLFLRFITNGYANRKAFCPNFDCQRPTLGGT